MQSASFPASYQGERKVILRKISSDLQVAARSSTRSRSPIPVVTHRGNARSQGRVAGDELLKHIDGIQVVSGVVIDPLACSKPTQIASPWPPDPPLLNLRGKQLAPLPRDRRGWRQLPFAACGHRRSLLRELRDSSRERRVSQRRYTAVESCLDAIPLQRNRLRSPSLSRHRRTQPSTRPSFLDLSTTTAST